MLTKQEFMDYARTFDTFRDRYFKDLSRLEKDSGIDFSYKKSSISERALDFWKRDEWTNFFYYGNRPDEPGMDMGIIPETMTENVSNKNSFDWEEWDPRQKLPLPPEFYVDNTECR
jgi:hypothetical protein